MEKQWKRKLGISAVMICFMFILTEIFLLNGPPLLTLKPWETRVNIAKLICSMGVLNFKTFKLVVCMYNKLRLQAAILSYWVFDVILSSIQPSEVQLVSFECEQWRTMKS